MASGVRIASTPASQQTCFGHADLVSIGEVCTRGDVDGLVEVVEPLVERTTSARIAEEQPLNSGDDRRELCLIDYERKAESSHHGEIYDGVHLDSDMTQAVSAERESEILIRMRELGVTRQAVIERDQLSVKLLKPVGSS
jgi:hypothetical protein